VTVELFDDQSALRRPLGITLLAALYLFFLLVSASTFGNPFPFFGRIYFGSAAKFLVLTDSLFCLYLFLGVLQRQVLTWYMLLGYNLLQIGNTVYNLYFIPLAEIEAVTGGHIHKDALWTNNMIAALGMLLLTQYIFRHKRYFSNVARYLF
jgi:hypothetical protein